MLRAVLKWLAAHFCRKGDDGEETEDSRFVPSVLDASVRYAHGMSDSGAERELAQLEERGEQLEEQHRDG